MRMNFIKQRIFFWDLWKFLYAKASSSPSANILEEAEADGPMKSTQNQDHRSHTGPKYVTQIFMKIFGPEIGPHIFG